MQLKLKGLARTLVEKMGQPGLGSVTITDAVIKKVPEVVRSMLGSSFCDDQKCASP